MTYRKRLLEGTVVRALKHNPAVALLGPRQCGKSTLAKHLLASGKPGVYLDLEKPSDAARLSDPEWFLSSCKGKLVCVDEIQRKPDLFPVLRSLIDEWGGNGRFLLLGSASRELIGMSSETLAGRVSHQRLTPFLHCEIPASMTLERQISRGGFPRSVNAATDAVSFAWREDFIASFLERDLRFWPGFSPATMRLLWRMLAHDNGQTANYSRLAGALGTSDTTVRHYIGLLAETFMVEIVPPHFSNLGKRLIKAPKVYLSDSGVTAALLGLRNFQELCAHSAFGGIWEQVVLANLKGAFPEAEVAFYRTAQGAEMDFVLSMGGKILAIECKASVAPSINRGTRLAIEDIQPIHTLVVSPVASGWPMESGITVCGLSDMAACVRKHFGTSCASPLSRDF
jgi:predicted AAA+ superfamily ATPase